MKVDRSAVRLLPNELAPATYIAMAKEIKMESPSTDEAEVLTSIFDNEFHVYNFDKVDQYLYRQALKQGTNAKWGWKSLRSTDLQRLLAVGSQSLPTSNGVVFAKIYGKRVPQQIMADVKCVLDSVPDALFLISDYEVVRPDPFLSCNDFEPVG